MNQHLASSIVEAHRKGRPIGTKYSLALAAWWAYASYVSGTVGHKALQQGDVVEVVLALAGIAGCLLAFTICLRSAATTKDRQHMFDLSHNVICNALDVVELNPEAEDAIREARRA